MGAGLLCHPQEMLYHRVPGGRPQLGHLLLCLSGPALALALALAPALAPATLHFLTFQTVVIRHVLLEGLKKATYTCEATAAYLAVSSCLGNA